MPGTETSRVLVIDDEEQIRRFLRISLKSQGYTVLEAATAAQGIAAFAARPDLVVLDLGLPDADGKNVLAQIRARSAVPVIVLSVRASEAEKVLALDAGANDYVTKPFGVQEFLARVRNLLRAPPGGAATASTVYDDGRLHVDVIRRLVEIDGQAVRLTPKEFALLTLLVSQADRVLTQSQLLREVWGPTHTRDSHYLRNFIGKIRQKLGDDSGEPRYLQTEAGIGYRFLDRRGD